MAGYETKREKARNKRLRTDWLRCLPSLQIRLSSTVDGQIWGTVDFQRAEVADQVLSGPQHVKKYAEWEVLLPIPSLTKRTGHGAAKGLRQRTTIFFSQEMSRTTQWTSKSGWKVALAVSSVDFVLTFCLPAPEHRSFLPPLHTTHD